MALTKRDGQGRDSARQESRQQSGTEEHVAQGDVHAARDEIKEWWTGVLLGQQKSAHPVFGSDIRVRVDGDVVTLNGKVATATEVEDLEAEARKLPNIGAVINHLTITGFTADRHMQTVIGVFSDREEAELARQSVEVWKMRKDNKPDVLDHSEEARPRLQELAWRAQIPEDVVDRYLQELEKGRVLLVDRVPEDEALRVISALEGTSARSVQTLPPEPAESVRR
jgi:hypothetical protein